MTAPNFRVRDLRCQGFLTAVAVIVFITACSSGEKQSSKVKTAKTTETTNPAPVQDAMAAADQEYKIIPSTAGDWDVMWSELRNLPQVALVTAKEDHAAILKAAKEGKSVSAVSAPRIAAFDIDTRNGKLKAWGIFTDSALLKPGTTLLTQPTVDLLISAFHNQKIDAVSFNPYTSYSNKEVFSYTIEKLYVARLIGYLQGETPELGKTDQAAVDSLEKENFFQTIYLGLLAYDRREKEPWQNAELAKIEAMDKLGFKAMAVSELDWFIRKFGPNPKADELKKKIAS